MLTHLLGVIRQSWPTELLDVSLVSLCVHRVLSAFLHPDLRRTAVGALVVMAIGLLAVHLNMLMLGWGYSLLGQVALAAFVVLFVPELRQMLVGLSPELIYPKPSRYLIVEEIVRAAERLSSNRIGALIAIERIIGLEERAAWGVRLNAELSAEFLRMIFYPNSPLHDGMVIVRGNVVLAACCFGNLAPGPMPHGLGTRHRAAVGMSQVSDAVIVVVSQERGWVSVAERGELAVDLTRRELRDRLLRAFGVARPSEPSSAHWVIDLVWNSETIWQVRQGIQRWIRGEWRLRLLALAIAILGFCVLVAWGGTT